MSRARDRQELGQPLYDTQERSEEALVHGFDGVGLGSGVGFEGADWGALVFRKATKSPICCSLRCANGIIEVPGLPLLIVAATCASVRPFQNEAAARLVGRGVMAPAAGPFPSAFTPWQAIQLPW